MKVTKVPEHDPKYPRKPSAIAIKAGAIAAAAVIAAGSAGCGPFTAGAPAVEETPGVMGAPVVEETPCVTDEPELMGDVAADPGSFIGTDDPSEGRRAMGEPPIDGTEIAPDEGSEDK